MKTLHVLELHVPSGWLEASPEALKRFTENSIFQTNWKKIVCGFKSGYGSRVIKFESEKLN
jgi:hypothetical protein